MNHQMVINQQLFVDARKLDLNFVILTVEIPAFVNFVQAFQLRRHALMLDCLTLELMIVQQGAFLIMVSLTHAIASVTTTSQLISSKSPDSPMSMDLTATLGMPGRTQIASRAPNTNSRTGALGTSTGATLKKLASGDNIPFTIPMPSSTGRTALEMT